MKRPGDAILAKPIQVTLRKGETVDRMIKRFSRKVRNEGILKEHVDSKRFQKPSDMKRKKRLKAKWNALQVSETRKKV